MNIKENCLQEKNKQVYLDGVRKFMMKGIPIFIDGEKVEEDGLERLFSPPEGTFYMADFVIEEMPEAIRTKAEPARALREGGEEGTPYSPSEGRKRFTLKEIRFDPAYH